MVIYYIMKIQGKEDFILLLTDKGEVYSWGNNNVGQLGIGTMDYDYHKPSRINFPLDIPIRYISAGEGHAAAIDFDYNVYIWGRNYHYYHQGYIDSVDIHSPTIIKHLTKKKVEKIYCNYYNTIAITQNGEIYTWGSNYDGNLGTGNNNHINTPTKLNFPNNTIIKKLYTGYDHTFAIDTCSNIYSWGKNNNYQLCRGDNMQQSSPSIACMLQDFNIKKIVCLTGSTIILADNKLYSIGRDKNGELGLGIDETNKLTLIVEGVEKVWGFFYTVFCKMANGDIYAWGLNHCGQLGIGNKTNQNTPVKLNIQLDIKSIYYCCGMIYAITTSGEIYTWGKNKLVSDELIMEPTLFTYFIDNDIQVKSMNRTKSARKIDYQNIL